MLEVTFPIAGYTFLFDAMSQVWSTLQTGAQDGGAHNIRFITTFNFNNFCADAISGNVYFLATGTNTDNGQPIKRSVTSRHFYQGGNTFGIDEIFFDMETGNGLQTGQGSDPIIMMEVSKDGGRTYNTVRYLKMGKVGQYKSPRVIARRLGSSRDFVIRLTLTDPVPFIMSSASAVVRGGTEEAQ